MLEIERLGFRYPGQEADSMVFDLSVSSGEILSLIGPSGSGKSTLLNLIAGFHQAQQGSIRLDGQAIRHLPASARPVTIVFQQYNLFPHLDVYTNVALGVNPVLTLSANESLAIEEALERVGLSGLEARKPGALSGGQRQRVALARALVRNRKILLLDEAFAALGPALREELILLVKDLVEQKNMTALLVSHQPGDAILASKRTAFIHRGRVEAIDQTTFLLKGSGSPEVRRYLGSV